MPMDLVTWEPRVGAAVIDRYTVPAESPVAAGLSVPLTDIFTSVTLVKVNTCSYFNQILAELERRKRVNAIRNFTTPTLISAGDPISAAKIIEIHTAINALRRAENAPTFAATDYAFTVPAAMTSPVIREVLYEMRAALAHTNYVVYYPPMADRNNRCLPTFQRYDTTYGTQTIASTWELNASDPSNIFSSGGYIGKMEHSAFGANGTVRARAMFNRFGRTGVAANDFYADEGTKLPAGHPTPISAEFCFSISSVVNTLETDQGYAFIGAEPLNTDREYPDLAALQGTYMFDDFFTARNLGVFNMTPGDKTLSIPVAAFNAANGYTLTPFAFYFGLSKEIFSLGAGISKGSLHCYCKIGNPTVAGMSTYTNFVGSYLKLVFA